jgi:hypothetical protein
MLTVVFYPLATPLGIASSTAVRSAPITEVGA